MIHQMRRIPMLEDIPTLKTEGWLAKAKQPSADAMRLHSFYKGRVETMRK
jgi:hypothetical protein